MGSSILEIAKKLRNLTQKAAIATSLRSRSASTESVNSGTSGGKKVKKNLLSRIKPFENQTISIKPVLTQWTREGGNLTPTEFRSIVRTLQSFKRYHHALQVSEWQSRQDINSFSSADLATQVELIGKIRGAKSAEVFFNSIKGGKMKDIDKVYCTLLHCYTREQLVDKSLSLLQDMKDLRLASTFAYNFILLLYKDTNQVEKIPDVLLEMTKEGYLPDGFSYRRCIEAYGAKSDFVNMERILDEMENIPHITTDWGTYSTMANVYIEAGDREKAMIYLNKCEERIGKDAMGYNHLISHHANLGNIKEVMRLWKLQKESRKKQLHKNYVVIIDVLVKLGELQKAEKILKEWESSCKFYDFHMPNILLKGYCQKGLTKIAESTLNEIIAKRKTPIPDSWCIVATGYLGEKNMEKTFECFKKALALNTELTEWKPEPTIIMAILDWLVDFKDVEEVRAFIDLVKNTVPVNKEMYPALIRAYKRSGKKVDGILERMKSDGIEVDEETEKLLKAQVQ